MKWSSWLLGSLAVAALTVGCGGERRSDDAGAAGTGTETGTMQGDAGISSDTAIPEAGGTGSAAGADTAQGGTRIQRDTNNPATGSDTTSRSPSDTIRPSDETTANPSQ